jgi:hypothetical protein
MMPAPPAAAALPSGCAPAAGAAIAVVVNTGALPGVAVLAPEVGTAEEAGAVAPGEPAVAPPGTTVVGAPVVVAASSPAEPQAPSSNTAAVAVAPIKELLRVCAPCCLFTSFLPSRWSTQNLLSPLASNITRSALDSAPKPHLFKTHRVSGRVALLRSGLQRASHGFS